MNNHPCSACKHLLGRSCCEPSKEDNGGPWHPLTYSEAVRIALATRMPLVAAVRVERVNRAMLTLIRKVHPFEASQVVDGVGLFLQKWDGSTPCPYLGPRGCTLGEAKPNSCYLYPFERKGKRWTVLDHPGHQCLVQNWSRGNVAQAKRMFDVTREQLDVVWKRWQEDRKTHAIMMRERVIPCYLG